MADAPATSAPKLEQRFPINGYETIAWRWMRYSAFLLIPLAFGHVLIQDVIFGVHAIDTAYVAARWANLFWRAYDAFLLTFAFAHGMNGFRQVLSDYITSSRARQVVAWVLLAAWLVISAIGSIALIGGVR
jgi:succinate dehydrogenase / fumarate reductase membrane anchor subunit